MKLTTSPEYSTSFRIFPYEFWKFSYNCFEIISIGFGFFAIFQFFCIVNFADWSNKFHFWKLLFQQQLSFDWNYKIPWSRLTVNNIFRQIRCKMALQSFTAAIYMGILVKCQFDVQSQIVFNIKINVFYLQLF